MSDRNDINDRCPDCEVNMVMVNPNLHEKYITPENMLSTHSNREIGGIQCLRNQIHREKEENKSLKAIKNRLENAKLTQTGWEADEDIVLLNGEPIGMTIRKHSREFDRWWSSFVKKIVFGEIDEEI